VPAASVAAAVAPAAAMEATAAAVKATAAAMKATAATMEATAAAEAFTAESTAVEPATMKAAIKATATVEAAMRAAIRETISVPEAKATAPETMKPGTCADEDAAVEPVRSVVSVGRAGVRIIVVIAIGAGGSCAVIDRPSKSNAEGDALSVRIRSRKETNTEKNTE
jgi:hypothetical protein